MFSANGSQVSSAATYIEDVFSTYLYTGNGTSQTITNNIDLSTKGGMVWFKSRSNVLDHATFDTVSGATLRPNSTGANTGYYPTYVGANSSGFYLNSVGDYFNTSGATMASWTFRKQPKFFDVVTWTGNGTNSRQISHSLGSKPGAIIFKCTSTAGRGWPVYHQDIFDSGSKIVYLNTTAASSGGGPLMGIPTSTYFVVNNDSETNANGATYIAYIFASDAGGFGLTGTDNVISCGSYTGNGSTQSISLGYEPQWVMIKQSSAIRDWIVLDTMRPFATAPYNKWLNPNTSDAEETANSTSSQIEPTATGFNLTNSGSETNVSGGTYIYIAIRRGPMKVPTDATKVFKPRTAYGPTLNTTATFTTNFPVDSSWIATRNTTGYAKFLVQDRLRTINNTTTSNTLITFNASKEADNNTYATFDYANNTGYTLKDSNGSWNGNTSTLNLGYDFRRSPGFFDVVCYTGDGLASRTVSHNLGVVPEMVIVKTRDGDSATGDWIVYHKDLSEESATKKYWLTLNATAGQNTSIYGGMFSGAANQSATAFKFTNDAGFLGYYYYNYTAKKYVAYLFATCPGVSKVGSYTGTGTTKQVNCGFAAGARFVLIKRTDASGDWYVWDTARGIVSGNDPYLLLNSDAAEVTTTDYIDTYTAGFELSSTAPAALNASGGTYIFLAIA